MSFLEKQKYSLLDVRYGRQDLVNKFYMSQFPSNQDIYKALIDNNLISSFSKEDEFIFKRNKDKWYKPTVQIFQLMDGPQLVWEIQPC